MNKQIKPMSISLFSIAAIVSGVISGIAHAQDVADSGVSKLVLQVNTDSKKVKGRHVSVVKYQGDNCEKPKRDAKLFKKRYLKDSHLFPALELPASEEFHFQVDYREQRRKDDRFCSVLVGFVPEPNRTYKALFNVVQQVSRCEVLLVDTTNEEKILETRILPEYLCGKSNARRRNGVPIHSVHPLS